VSQLKASGEIATELSISTSTVNSYVAEAVQLLGARNRREAAMALSRHENGAPEKHGVEGTRVVPVPSPDPPFVPPEVADTAAGPMAGWSRPLRFRRRGQADNDLFVASRLLWVPVLAVGVAIGFGMLMNGLQIAAALIERFSRVFS
jgi:hypothetical protein